LVEKITLVARLHERLSRFFRDRLGDRSPREVLFGKQGILHFKLEVRRRRATRL